jgi:DNA-binding GntR family transcriptional regulator
MNEIHALARAESNNDTQPVHQQVYEALCDSILAGQFVPGVSVTLRGIADQLGVSPMPVREAIRRLVAERALQVLSNRRVCVTLMTRTRLQELYHARLSLEPELALLAMPNITKRDVKNLRHIDEELNHSLRSGDVDAYIRCNRRFHFSIYERADSPVLCPLVRSLWLQFSPFTRIVFGRMGTEILQDYHADALLSLQAGDKQAFARAIESDIREGMDLLAEHIQRDTPE